ncbi:MAG: beta-lactamase family protein, partial [Chloroflexota bacterium]|nr:beta-lactamase family protein [Chloroflexota bacterium]
MTGSPTTDDVAERMRRVENGVILEPFLRSRPPDTRPLAERMALFDVPGVSIAVINNYEIEWARGYGVREAGGSESVTEHTLFQACSISKPITALAVMRLVQEGRLNLDEDVNEYLLSWKVPANNAWQPKVTLRQLLSHTAGTTVHGFPGYRRDRQVPGLRQVLDGEPPANTPAIRVNAVPGTQFRYSGGGTSIVQQLLMDVTRMPFPQLMRELVLEPLGMEDSTYEQPLPEARWSDAATGHRTGGELVAGKWHIYPEMAAAGLWTTPSDLARAALELQRVRAGRTGKLVTRETVDQMLTAQAGGPVGIGFWPDGKGETLRFGHGGDNEGFKCELTAYAEHGLGAAVMTNGDMGWLLCQEVMAGIAREYRWPLAPDQHQGFLY